MVKHFILLQILTFCPLISLQENGYCERDTCDSNNLNKNSIEGHEETYARYIVAAKKAKETYVPVQTTNCSCYFDTLQNDLLPFTKGISSQLINKIRNRGTTYVIYDHKLYRGAECSFSARCSGVEYFLKKLLPKLPNAELILNVRDWPQISKHFEPKGPVLSFSKTADYLDIQYPAWSFWEGGPAIRSYPKGIGRWDQMRDVLIKQSEKWSWERKIGKGFFRGSRTSEERDPVVLLSRSNPDIVDAAYTKNQAWKSMADTLNAEPADEVSLEGHCRYKYLFNMRGVAASFRFKHLFLCRSLIIHFGDDYTEFFYGALKPWIHYVPISANANQQEISSLLNFLINHDELAKEIADRGYEFIVDHLRMKDVLCYWRQLIKRYAKLLDYNVTIGANLVQV